MDRFYHNVIMTFIFLLLLFAVKVITIDYIWGERYSAEENLNYIITLEDETKIEANRIIFKGSRLQLYDENKNWIITYNENQWAKIEYQAK